MACDENSRLSSTATLRSAYAHGGFRYTETCEIVSILTLIKTAKSSPCAFKHLKITWHFGRECCVLRNVHDP